MVNISQHKTEQKKALAKANIKLQMAKQIFSEEFSSVLHEFSKTHYNESLKTFRQSWQEWISTTGIQTKMRNEIERIKKNNFIGTDEEITQKIYTSARFYYRKKDKRAKKLATISQEEISQKPVKSKSKPYIGLSKTFIQFIDETIKNKILEQSVELTRTMTIKLDQKQEFQTFTKTHINEISAEFGKLKIKYDELEEAFVPKEIASKLKKAYQNRFYSIYKMINGMNNE
jgi:hypothetical protein